MRTSRTTVTIFFPDGKVESYSSIENLHVIRATSGHISFEHETEHGVQLVQTSLPYVVRTERSDR